MPKSVRGSSKTRKPGGNVGLRDVARLAGVSTATVSRATNNSAPVSPELREKIEKASRELGWVLDGAARALTTRRSGAVGAVFPTLSHGDFARATEALQDELRRYGYTLLLAVSHYDQEQEYQLVRQFLQRGIDALVLVGNLHKPELMSLIEQRNLPYVNTFVFEPKSKNVCIGPDNRKALQQLTDYLFQLGHRRFGVIAQEMSNNDRAAARMAGIRDTLGRHNIELKPSQIAVGRWGIREGRELFRQVMAANPRPTAIICGNAYQAVGAVLEASAQGITMPDELSIVGYDDIEVMDELPVTITTVRVRSDEVGRRAAQFVMSRLENRPIDIEWECATEIIRRRSSGPAPRRRSK
jgi:LacI family transcriptional regulator